VGLYSGLLGRKRREEVENGEGFPKGRDYGYGYCTNPPPNPGELLIP